MPSTTAAEEKAALRARIRAEMKSLSEAERQESDGALFARFLELEALARVETVLLYHGMGAEPDTGRLIPVLLARGHRVALPRCRPGGGLEARLVTGETALTRHPYGMLEPGEDCPGVEKPQIGLILVPGLAFDKNGVRLGQGGGYYDRYLSGFGGVAVALCRERFLLSHIPAEPHDRPVDLVLTEAVRRGQ